MQLEDPSVLETSSGEAVVAVKAAHEGVNGGEMIGVDATNSGEEKKGREERDEGDADKITNCGRNRWPRQETLALLKIRSEMDAVFRDSSLKGPLWEEVSRKLAELGYQRSAKKCKEKFENVYKYHKRTKESRSGKSEGKIYKFFDQLQTLENHQVTVSYPPKPQPTSVTNTVTTLPTRPSDTTAISYVATVPSTNPAPAVISPSPPSNATITCTVVSNPRNPSPGNNNVPYNSLPNMNLFSTTSTSSSTASDEDLEERYRKKRKWKDYFRKLIRQVLAKQGEMQKNFLEVIDKREREQVAQYDAWRMQEMARINSEHEILVQERLTAEAKDAAVIAFLHKLSEQQNPAQAEAGVNFLQQLPTPRPQQPQPSPPPVSQVQPQQQQQQLPQPLLMSNNTFEIQKMNNGHNTATFIMNSSRWPKEEVHALIRLRTSLETKYQENVPKAPLWEDISAGMQRLGYNSSAKRCKEKWENINKYFKKVKESNKQRREDSKTCPYFHELEALYKEKSKTQNSFGGTPFHNMKLTEMMEPLMVQPEQEWRPSPQYEHEQQPLEEGPIKENEGQYQVDKREVEEEGEKKEDNDDVKEDGESVEEEGGSRYEIATNKFSSVDTVE